MITSGGLSAEHGDIVNATHYVIAELLGNVVLADENNTVKWSYLFNSMRSVALNVFSLNDLIYWCVGNSIDYYVGAIETSGAHTFTH